MRKKKKIVWWRKVLNSIKDFIKFIINWIKIKNKEQKIRVRKAIAKANKEAKEKPVLKKEIKLLQAKPAIVLLSGFLLGFLVLSSILLVVLVIVFYTM